jgi:hypothetical protein
MTIMAIFWLALAALVIWQNKSRSSLVWAGVIIGWASWALMDTFMPLFAQVLGGAFGAFQALGLGGFMLLVGGITVVMIWALDR